MRVAPAFNVTTGSDYGQPSVADRDNLDDFDGAATRNRVKRAPSMEVWEFARLFSILTQVDEALSELLKRELDLTRAQQQRRKI